MNVITDLQGSRPVIVRIFDELVNTLPDGVYYESLVRVEDTISIEGIAESYLRITELLRRLDDSEWFQESDLDDISAVDAGDNSLSAAFTFTLSLSLQLSSQVVHLWQIAFLTLLGKTEERSFYLCIFI